MSQPNLSCSHPLFVYLHRIFVPEWWLSYEEFVDENAKSPPIDGNSVAYRNAR